MDLGVQGKAFVIVGGSRDMGYEAARILSADGARLALIGRSEASAGDAAEALAKETGGETLGLGADASQPGEVEVAIERAASTFGGFDGLLTTAGWVSTNGMVTEASDADFEAVYQNIFMSVVRSVRAALPYLLASGASSVVTTSAYSIHAPKAFLAAYSAQKHAVANFTKNMATTYGPQGLRANCVCPGAVKTAVVRSLIEERAAAEGRSEEEVERILLLDEWKMPVALQRLGEPHELGELMAFLLSPRAAYTTGATINIDGGTDF
ncbi:MAG: SDR family oxidoreductase [Ilumatobacteraceae bacterium]